MFGDGEKESKSRRIKHDPGTYLLWKMEGKGRQRVGEELSVWASGCFSLCTFLCILYIWKFLLLIVVKCT